MLRRLKYILKAIIRGEPKPLPLWTNQNIQFANFSIGDWTYGTPDVRDWHQGTTLIIGKYCSIAERTAILLGGEHYTDWITTFPFTELLKPNSELPLTGLSKGNVTIGHDVWIGWGATILSGVTIGSGAIIGAGSVVTKSVEHYSIVAGNPARHIRFRIPERFIPQMLNIAWWDWPDDKVLAAAPLLLSNKIEEFVKRYA